MCVVGVVWWDTNFHQSPNVYSLTLVHRCENPYFTIFSKKLNFQAQKNRPRKNLEKTCWETAVTKRLAIANYWGVGFGFDSSNCTKNVVSYHSIPPPNPPLNILISPLHTSHSIFILPILPVPSLKFTKN